MTADLAVPAFVWRGITLLTPGLTHISFRNEADIRDGLATLWWLHGAESVRTEVAVPNCGRIDLLVEVGDGTTDLWEVKKEISTVSAARKAYQQASTYRRYIAAQLADPWHVAAYVVAGDLSAAVAKPAETAFEDIVGMEIGHAMFRACSWHRSSATWHADALRRQRAREAVVADLAFKCRSAGVNLATAREQMALPTREDAA